MANINLLPWREELREERKKEFLVTLGIVIGVAFLLLFVGDRYVNKEIDNQTALNDYLREQIVVLDRELEEIRDIRAQKEELTDRMTVIQDLQGRRPVIVRLFDELVRTLPEGVYYNQITRSVDTISFEGVAESNNHVSDLLRAVENSEWFEGTDLQSVSSDPTSEEDNRNIFQFTVTLTDPQAEEE